MRVKENIIYNVSYQFVSKLSVFLLNIVLARYLIVADFGSLSIILTINFVLSSFVDFGSNQLIVRYFSNPAGEHIKVSIYDFLLFKVLNYFIFAPLVILGYYFYPASAGFKSNNLLYLLFLIPLFENVISLIINYQSSQLNFKRSARLQFLHDTLKSLISICFFLIYGINGYIISLLVYHVLFSFLLYYSTFRSQNLFKEIKAAFYKQKGIFSYVLSFFLLAISTQLFVKADLFGLSVFSNDTQVGYYSTAFKLYENMMFLPAAIMGVLLPTINNNVAGNKTLLLETFEKIQNKMVLGLMPVVFIGLFFSNTIIDLLYGAKYANSGILLKIFFIKFGILLFNGVYYTQILLVKLNKTATKSYLVLISISLLVCYILTKNFNATGAAISSLIGEVLLTIAFIFILKKNGFNLKVERQFVFIFSFLLLLIIVDYSTIEQLIYVRALTLLIFLLIYFGIFRKDYIKIIHHFKLPANA